MKRKIGAETKKINIIREYAKFFRVQVLGTSVTAVIGALSVKGFALELSDFVILFVMGAIGTIAGYVFNDYCDVEIDKYVKDLRERPLVKGTISRRTALNIYILFNVINFLLLLIFYGRILPVTIRIISMVLGPLYHMLSKRLVGSDIFVAGSMAFFCLFGAVAVSEDIQGLRMISGLTWTVVLLVFVHVLFMNIIEGSLKDVENDRRSGVKNLAIILGVKAGEKKMLIPNSFKAIAILLNIITAVFVFIPFLFFDLAFWNWQIILLILFVISMFVITIKLISIDIFDRKKIGHYSGRKEFISYTIVLIMLMGFVGFPWTIFLILLPVIWFILFNYVLHGHISTFVT